MGAGCWGRGTGELVFMDIEVQFGKIVRFWRWWWWVLNNVNVLNVLAV